MPAVRLHPSGITLEACHGARLWDLLHGYGVEFPCGGTASCGGCKLRLLQGNIPLSEKHVAALRKKNLDPNIWRLACMSMVETDLTLEVGQWEHPILADSTPFDFIPQNAYGIAVDLGSTTIVSQLLDLSSGRVAAVHQSLNPQAKFGADIMSRISFALAQKGNAEVLRKLTHEAVGGHVAALLKAAPQADLRRVVVVGNTVMHHLFCGIDLSPLAAFPFLTEHCESLTFAPHELGWSWPQQATVCFAPNLGSFVGSDILAGIFATRMHEKKSYNILIDLGTNGEIAVGSSNQILFASTSAGPAFEGAAISCGMSAGAGAIASAWRNKQGQLQLHVMGNRTAQGICGSGLVDMVAALVQSGEVDASGAIAGDAQHIALTDKLRLTQRDLRELQLAKAAIATGVELLMRQLGIGYSNVDKVFLAGAFGSFLNLANARTIGLLCCDEAQVVKLGNSAMLGAKMLLFDNGRSAQAIKKIAQHISLETLNEFQDTFCEKLSYEI